MLSFHHRLLVRGAVIVVGMVGWLATVDESTKEGAIIELQNPLRNPQLSSHAPPLVGAKTEPDPPGDCGGKKGGAVMVGGEKVVVGGEEEMRDKVIVGGKDVGGEVDKACVDGLVGLEIEDKKKLIMMRSLSVGLLLRGGATEQGLIGEKEHSGFLDGRRRQVVRPSHRRIPHQLYALCHNAEIVSVNLDSNSYNVPEAKLLTRHGIMTAGILSSRLKETYCILKEFSYVLEDSWFQGSQGGVQ